MNHHPLRCSLQILALFTCAAHAQDALAPVQPPAEESKKDKLRDIVVHADRDATSYVANESPSLLKLGVPLTATPQSVTVVTEEVIENQAAQNLKDVYRNVSGVYESGNTLNAQSEVLPIIRGFEAPFVFRNGMRATQVGSVDLFNIESVEVLKGPASILFGGLEPGGVLNFTTKKPQAEPFHEIVQSFGSYEYFRTTIDSTGPLDPDGRVLYRINAALTNSESFRDHMDLERYAIAPSLLWRITDDTELGFDFAWTREKQPYDTGVPVAPDGTPLVPIETFFGDPHLAGRTLEDTFVGMDFKHRFNDIFTLRSRLQFHRAEPENEAIRNRGVVALPGGGYAVRQRYQNEVRMDDEYQWVTDLLVNFDTGPVKHNGLVGFDLIRQESQFDRFRVNTPNVPVTPFPNVSFTPPAGSFPRPDVKGNTEWAAFYAQDQMTMLDDKLHFLIGGRFDWVDQQQTLPRTGSSEESELTGRAGLLYEATDWLSPYVSYSQSFRPQLLDNVDKQGQVLEPHTGNQIEGGFKFDFWEERLIATLSGYQIEKQNVAVFDNAYFIATGLSTYYPGVEQRSRGVELDVTGKITETLSVVANYAYTDTETLQNPEAPTMVGRRLGGVPLNAARLWLAYNFPEESALKGLGFGAGVRYESERLASFADQVTLDDFVLFDAGVWYRHEMENGQAFKTQLNFQNITDEEYYPRASDQSIVHPGAPFTVMGSIGYEF